MVETEIEKILTFNDNKVLNIGTQMKDLMTSVARESVSRNTN